ncbi:V-type ATPase subunit, partial [Candidatus Aerophobetes bacterium]|nr:V-type ATPase subunit [Candidatus Aerophobetes bacterium]
GYPLQKALEEWKDKQNLSVLDNFFDKSILKYTKVGLYITFGREPLINYIFLKKNELKKLRKILRGKYYVANSHTWR